MNEHKHTEREDNEIWGDIFHRMDSLSSTICTIHHAMENEGVPDYILDTYITIFDAIAGIEQFASSRIQSATE